MANPSIDPVAGRVHWRRLLERVLPEVDLFLPSLAEACRLLGRRVPRDDQGAPALGSVARLADELLELGVAVAGIKLGEHGLLVRTATRRRIPAGFGHGALAWADRELYAPVFESHVVGTTGAGDATIAGFLFGLLTGLTPEATATAACAVGGSSTEAADGTSSVPSWPEIERRLARGWPCRATRPGAGWTSRSENEPWHGPRDG
jgi:sugar/nucleoside kinase (ribokinase family)